LAIKEFAVMWALNWNLSKLVEHIRIFKSRIWQGAPICNTLTLPNVSCRFFDNHSDRYLYDIKKLFLISFQHLFITFF
jgi:hypothetical protein